MHELQKIRAQGLDPLIADVNEQTRDFEEFMKIQEGCNEKMKRINRDFKEKKITRDGGQFQIMENIRAEMKRLEEL